MNHAGVAVATLLAACASSAHTSPPPAEAVSPPGPDVSVARAIAVGDHRPCEYVTTTDGVDQPMRTVLHYDGAPSRCWIPAFLPEEALACFSVREWPSSGERVEHTYDAAGRLVRLVDGGGETSTFTWDAAGLVGWMVEGEDIPLRAGTGDELMAGLTSVAFVDGRPTSILHHPVMLSRLRWEGDRLVGVERTVPSERGDRRVLVETADCH